MNASEVENVVVNGKNGTKTGQNAERIRKYVTHAKTSVDYWKTKVCNRSNLQNGLLYVRLRSGSRDVWISLATANRMQAASRARDLWVRMKAIGLDALLRELNPEPEPTTENDASVADAIAASARLSVVRPESFAGYAMKLRTLAGEVAGIPKPLLATSRSAPEARRWREAVGAVPLSALTKEAVLAWRKRRVDAAGGSPARRRSAEISADSTIRMARSVFSKPALDAGLATQVRLPAALGLCAVSTGASFTKFQSTVDPWQLFADAKAELERERPEVFLAFALGLCAALRRSEADRLRWDQIDLRTGRILISTTEAHGAKSPESVREVALAADVLEILRSASKAPDRDSEFVLRGGRPKQRIGAAPVYRADMAPYRTWRTLLCWLRGKGVSNRKPAHALRALAATHARDTHGLVAAAELLGHADVRTTARSYSAPTRVTISFAARPQPTTGAG
jgi:integrase